MDGSGPCKKGKPPWVILAFGIVLTTSAPTGHALGIWTVNSTVQIEGKGPGGAAGIVMLLKVALAAPLALVTLPVQPENTGAGALKNTT